MATNRGRQQEKPAWKHAAESLARCMNQQNRSTDESDLSVRHGSVTRPGLTGRSVVQSATRDHSGPFLRAATCERHLHKNCQPPHRAPTFDPPFYLTPFCPPHSVPWRSRTSLSELQVQDIVSDFFPPTAAVVLLEELRGRSRRRRRPEDVVVAVIVVAVVRSLSLLLFLFLLVRKTSFV